MQCIFLPSCAARAAVKRKGILGLWCDNVHFSFKGLKNPDLCLGRVENHSWDPSCQCIKSTFGRRSPCKATFLCWVKLYQLPVGCWCFKWRWSSSQLDSRDQIRVPQSWNYDVSTLRTGPLFLVGPPEYWRYGWSAIPPKCISLIREYLRSVGHFTTTCQSKISENVLSEQNRGKKAQFYQICCYFTQWGNIKAIVAVYFYCFTHVCSQKHNLIHLRPDTIHTSKGCKNLNLDRGKIEKIQLSHVPLGENKHIFSSNVSRDTCSVLSGLSFCTWPSSFQCNIISR